MSQKIKIKIPTPVNLNINDLILNENNVKEHPKEQIHDLVELIKMVGFKDPVVIDDKNNVWAGHGRLLAAKILEMSTVPCIYLEGLTEDQKKVFMLMDNKVNESPWIKQNIQLIYDSVEPLTFEPFQMDFEKQGISNGIEEETEPIPEPPEEPKSKLGDIYQLGKHRIMCGDSTKDLDKLMTSKAKIAFTSPPYNIGDSFGYQPNSKYATITDNISNYVDFLLFNNASVSLARHT